MNAVGAYGGLSFIAEAAARSGHEATARELGSRVHAYLALLRWLLAEAPQHAGELERASERRLPAFLPVNYFWAGRASSTARSRASRSSSAPPAGRSRSPPRT